MIAVLGFFGGLLAVAGSVPYIIETAKGRTRPHSVTWGVFTVVDTVSIANQLSAGAAASVWLVVGFAVANGTIFVLSLRRGVRSFDTLDIVVLCGTLLGLALWQALGSPSVSIIANVVVVGLALVPTYVKAWRDPASETAITFLTGAIAGLLSALSVGRLDFVLLVLPTFLVLAQGGLWAVLVLRGR